MIFEVSGDIYEDPSLYDEENTIRVCSECNKEMTEGYVIDGGLEYYCSDECLHKHYTEEEWLEKYDNGNSDSYWTSWEN